MFDLKNLSDIVSHFLESIPPGIKNLPKDLGKNFKSLLHQSVNKLNLVTREEFDIQIKVLARTRAKLQALEEKLNELERHQR
ncbi:accessory factor UbiK family protein [Coxiella endosymbiont of Dermacentor marginatus]|uniref:accessory factor UbiK family protein n=1 Tax=Coxiella endosymbiont of Dermacentor marginatus TaxID=1656159 RepID=UPI00222385DB|nr:accessory factor UbiK family protein [Coxiella endosymbiont of Dermacentor marginatus]